MRWAAFAEHLHGHRHHDHWGSVEPHEHDEDDITAASPSTSGPGPFRRRWRESRELWGPFEDWLDSLGDEIVAFAREQGSVKGADVAG